MRYFARHTFRPLQGRAGRQYILALWVLLALLGAVSPSQAREPYRIGYSAGAQFHSIARDRVQAVYERAGLAVEFVALPQKRSLLLANEGILDGEVGRIAGLEKRFPNLRRVDVKLMDLVGAAYVMKGWAVESYREDLLDVARVGSILGVLWVEKMMGDRHWERVNDYATLFDLLLAGRIDMALASTPSAEAVFRKGEGRYDRVRRIEPFLHVEPLYHYVHKKNARIIPLLEKSLRELRAEDYWHEAATTFRDGISGQRARQ